MELPTTASECSRLNQIVQVIFAYFLSVSSDVRSWEDKHVQQHANHPVSSDVRSWEDVDLLSRHPDLVSSDVRSWED